MVRAWCRGDLVHEIPPVLVLPFPLHQVLRLRPWPAPTWCTKSRRPCSSVSFAPSPPRFFARGRRRLGARNPASPCSSVPFAPSPPRFFARGRRRLGARNPAGPYISIPFALSPTRFFARGRRRLGARNPASPYISVPFAPIPPHFFTRGRAGVVPHRSLSLAIPSSFVLGHHVLEHRRKVMHERLPPAFVHHFSPIIFSKGKN